MRFPTIRTTTLALAAACLSARMSAGDPAGFAFLEVPAGARCSAMGGAFGAIEGVEAAFTNPARLEQVRGTQITASHYEFLENLRHAQFAVAGRVLGGGSALAVRAMYSEPIVERDALGNEIGTFGAHDLELLAVHGRDLGSGVKAGGSAQIVRERIAEFSATTFAFGLGATWDPEPWPRLRLGASGHSLGPAAHYDLDGSRGAPVPLPSAFQFGAAYDLPAGSFDLLGAIEGRLTRGRAGIGIFGTEVRYSGAAIRLGVRANDESTGFSAGAGYATGALKLDYAFVPYGLELGDTHRFSLSAQF